MVTGADGVALVGDRDAIVGAATPYGRRVRGGPDSASRTCSRSYPVSDACRYARLREFGRRWLPVTVTLRMSAIAAEQVIDRAPGRRLEATSTRTTLGGDSVRNAPLVFAARVSRTCSLPIGDGDETTGSCTCAVWTKAFTRSTASRPTNGLTACSAWAGSDDGGIGHCLNRFISPRLASSPAQSSSAIGVAVTIDGQAAARPSRLRRCR